MSELLAIKRPSRTQKLFSSIPIPGGYAPRNGLPMWEIMPLEHKIPRVPAPKGRIVYTRGTVGKPQMVKIQRDDFVPPNSGSTTMCYEPMHDYHLKRFFESKVTRKHLMKTGLMTEDGEEICTIDVFNEYRLYLRSVHGELVERERARLEALSREQRILALAQENAERDAKKASMWMARKERARTKKQREEQWKNYLLNKSLQQQQQQEQALAEYKRAQKIKIMAWSQALDKKIRECKMKSTHNARQRTIRTIRKWHREEIYLKKQQREKKKRKAKKEQEIEKWFHQKAEFQLQKINLINSLLKLEEEERQQSILERNLRFMKERERMNDLFQRIKNRREEKIKMEKRRKMSKLVTNVICDNVAPVVSDMQLNRKSVEETVNQAMQSFSATEKREATVAELLEETRSLLSRQSQMPVEIKSAFEQILDDTLHQVVRNKVNFELHQIIGRGLQTIEIVAPKNATSENGRLSTANNLPCPFLKGHDKVLCCQQPMPIAERENDRLNEEQRSSSIRKSLLNDVYYGLMRRSTQSSHMKRLSFGAAQTIGISSQEITVPELKSTKDRPPTPIASITDVAMVVFQSFDGDEKNKNEKLSESSIIELKEKDDLFLLIHQTAKEVSRHMFGKLQKEINLHSERKSRSITITMPEIVNHVAENIKNHGLEYFSMMEDLEWVASSLLNIILYSYWSVHYKIKVRTRPVSRSARCCFKHRRSSVLSENE